MTDPVLPSPEKCVRAEEVCVRIYCSIFLSRKQGVVYMAQRRQHLKKRADGRYACRYKNKWFMGATEREALEAREEYKRLLQTASPSSETMTVAQYAAKWLPLYKADCSAKTYNDYAKQLDAMISAIGSMLIRSVTVDDVQLVYRHYIGYSASTIKRARMLYVDMFDCAVEQDLIRHNPFTSGNAAPPKGYEGSHRALTPYEDQIILNVPADFRLPVMVMRYAGLRRGEMMALDIDRDVDFERGVIHVREAVRYDSNQPIISSPKTAAGVRTVPLLDILRHELAGHHGLVATSAAGTMMSESAFSSAWAKYINQVQVQVNGCTHRWYGKKKEHRGKELPPWWEFEITPHDLRHSYCTMLRDAGVDIKLAMRWMGHADEKMILRIYDHITEERIQDGTEKVENLLVRRQNRRQKAV